MKKMRKARKQLRFQKILTRLDACSEAKKWVGSKTIEKAWLECDESQWMCWWLRRVFAWGILHGGVTINSWASAGALFEPEANKWSPDYLREMAERMKLFPLMRKVK